MENDDKKSPRGLKDISHLFLSGAPVRDQGQTPAKSALMVCSDSWSDCSFEMNAALAKTLELDIHQADFHVFQERQDSLEARVSSSSLFCAPKVFEELVSDGEGKLYLVDFPWSYPDIIDSLMPLASALLVTVRPTIGSLKNAFRLLKGVSFFLKEEPFIRWEEPGDFRLQQISFQWSDLVKRFLSRELIWIDNLDPLKEKIRNVLASASSANDFSVGIALQQEEAMRRKRQRALHFQKDFLASAPAEPVPATETSFPSSSFYERARLSREEIAAFFALADQLPD